MLAGQMCYSLLLLSPVHAGHREGQRGLRMLSPPTCVSYMCNSSCTFHSARLGRYAYAPLSNWISLGCQSILHESWTNMVSGKSTIKAPFLATRVACGWPQRNG